jgi:hypothetical protein
LKKASGCPQPKRRKKKKPLKNGKNKQKIIGSGIFRLSENSKFIVFNERIVAGGGTASFAPTLTLSVNGAFGIIRGLFIFVKVGARSPRPHLVGVF